MPPTDSARALPRGLVIALVLLLLARFALALWERGHPPKLYDRVSWLAPAEAIDSSRLHRRPVLYDFSAEWCGPCKRLEAEVFSNEKSAAEIGTLFIPAKVLDRQQEEGRNPALVDSLQHRYSIDAFPTLLAATPEGEEVGRLVGYPGVSATRDSLRVFYRRAIALHDARVRGRLGAPASPGVMFPPGTP
jgi:thiol:disulfide interchange protein